MSRLATGRVRVLLLELPSALLLRMQLEAAIAARGCFVAESPADADALLVVGEAPAAFERLAAVAGAVYEMAAALDEIPPVLGDRNRQIRDARQRPQRVAENADGMDMGMSGPAGLPLAGGDDSDRDGLEMDVTHLTLGPLLPNWPAWCCTAPCTATSSGKRGTQNPSGPPRTQHRKAPRQMAVGLTRATSTG